MKKYSIILFLLLLLPIFSFGQQQNCITLYPPDIQNADSVQYCYILPSCYDSCDGSLAIQVFGANQPYSYDWPTDSLGNPVVGDNTRDSLCSNVIIVSILDASGSLVNNDYSIDLTAPSNFTIFNGPLTAPPICYGDSNGVIDISIGGLLLHILFLWNDGVSTESRDSLPSGVYNLTVTDFNGCVMVTQDYLMIDPLEITSTVVNDTLSCIGVCDGNAIVIPQNGTAPYSYEWYSNSNINPIIGENNDTTNSLCYGLHHVVITDAKGCLDTNEAFIANPDTLKVSTITIDSSCYQICDGIITVDVEGGKSPYSYNWDNGDITQSADSLCPGTYELIYYDVNNCSDTVEISITERDPFALNDWIVNDSCYNSCKGEIKVSILDKDKHSPPFIYDWSTGGTDTVISGLCSDTFSLVLIDSRLCRDTFEFFVEQGDSMYFDTITVIDNICYGDTNGAITINNFNGGVLPLSFTWTNGSTNQLTTAPGINSLSAGFYSVHVEDSWGCTLDSANIEVKENDSLFVITSYQDALCHSEKGLIDLSFFGGVEPYTLSIPQIGLFTNLTSDSIITDSVSAGEYIYTIFDATGCPPIQDTILISEPDPLTITDSVIDVLCNGEATGEIHITSTQGGVAPYLYSIDGINFQSQNYFDNLTAGQYSIIIKDANDCILNSQLYNISEPLTAIAASLSGPTLECFGDLGDIILQVSGGTPSYTFLWGTGSNSQNLTGIGAGTYSVNILDSNNCPFIETITVVEPDDISLAADIRDLDCFQDGTGEIDINITGGTPIFSPIWNGPNGFTSNTFNIDNLSSGTYDIEITDINSCNHQESFFVDEPDSLELSSNNQNVDCFGNSTGEIDLDVQGGTEPYSYSWSNLSNQEDLTGVPSGSYIVDVVDNNGCSDSYSTLIEQPSQIVISNIDPINLICNNIANGEILISVTGGSPEYSYSIDGGYSNQSSNLFTDLFAGSYNILVEDQNGCQVIDNIILTQPTQITISQETITDVIGCYGDPTGSIDVTISDGVPPYTYQWNYNGDLYNFTTPQILNLTGGSYELIVTDANNCTLQEFYNVNQPAQFDISPNISLPCEDPYGDISLFVDGGTGTYSYQWYFDSDILTNETTSSISNMPVGTYIVEINDINGCDTMAVYEIYFDSDCIFIPSGFTPNGDGIHDTWEIDAFENVSDLVVQVYNRWGQEVFVSKGSYEPWDGTFNSIDLPIAAYYYVIEANGELFKGIVTIKR